MKPKVTIARNDRKLKRVAIEAVNRAVQKSLEVIQSDAVMNAPANLGQLKSSIFTAVDEEGTKVSGTVYTDLEHGWYVEFGTGPVGAADHDGISPEVPVAYRTTGWLIPGDAISDADALKYKFKKVIFKDGSVWYATNGQPAQPFMYPAFMNNVENVEAFFQNALADAVKEAKLK